MTLQKEVRLPFMFSARKQGLCGPIASTHDYEEYADERINEMTNAEFLSSLSDALENLTLK